MECFQIVFKNPPGNSQGQGILGLIKFLSTSIFSKVENFSLAVSETDFFQLILRTFFKLVLKSDLCRYILVTKMFYLQDKSNSKNCI